MLTIKAISICL